MISKTFIKNEKGKIEFTERELKELLDEVYNNGYQDGKGTPVFVYTSPSWWKLNQPYYTYTTSTANTAGLTNTTSTSSTSGKIIIGSNESEGE